MTSASYTTRRAILPADKAGILALWSGNLGQPALMAWKFDWFYEKSPTGVPLALLLTCSGDSQSGAPALVGVAAAGRRTFAVGNAHVDARVLGDMTVSPQHRSLYPALLLQRSMLAAGFAEGPLMYGFPNPKAAAVFQRAGYSRLGSIKRYARVLRSSEYLRKYLPAPLAAVVGSVADRLAQLWLELRTPGAGALRLRWNAMDDAEVSAGNHVSAVEPLIAGIRSREFLQWRFVDHHSRKCHFISVRAATDDRQHGYWVAEPQNGILLVRDCSPALLAGGDARKAWRLLFAAARSRGFRSVYFECFGPQRFLRTLTSVGMLPRGERPVFTAVRDDLLAATATTSWYLTAADEDE